MTYCRTLTEGGGSIQEFFLAIGAVAIHHPLQPHMLLRILPTYSIRLCIACDGYSMPPAIHLGER